jgi:hypothetical protein
MFVNLPKIGQTDCDDLWNKIEEYKDYILGGYFIMCGYGYEEKILPTWWYEIKNSDELIKKVTRDDFKFSHDNPAYLGFVIIAVKNIIEGSNPDFIIKHVRMCTSEGIAILRLFSKNNIPINTKARFPYQYHEKKFETKVVFDGESQGQGIKKWKQEDWHNYCLDIYSSNKLI